MLKNLRFSRQPIVWLTLVVLVGQSILDLNDGDGLFDATSWGQKLLIAAGGAIAWSQVTPVKAPNIRAIDEKLADPVLQQSLLPRKQDLP